MNDPSLVDEMEKCAHTYYHFSGVEIWNFRMIDITIDQIKYFIPFKVFKNKNAAIEILDELEEFIYHLEKICTTGTKRFETKDALNKSNLKVYINEILNSNEVILVTSDQGDTVFSTIDTPNFIRTSETRMINHIKTWLKTTVKHSTQISGEGEKDRRIMFEKIHSKFQKAKLEIRSLLDYVYS
ncbi:MAG: hypothetical protein HOP11_01750 [Saprospiraceae bacterium]|nr:hypothetical protein [Saprospiraceae bacterium]